MDILALCFFSCVFGQINDLSMSLIEKQAFGKDHSNQQNKIVIELKINIIFGFEKNKARKIEPKKDWSLPPPKSLIEQLDAESIKKLKNHVFLDNWRGEYGAKEAAEEDAKVLNDAERILGRKGKKLLPGVERINDHLATYIMEVVKTKARYREYDKQLRSLLDFQTDQDPPCVGYRIHWSSTKGQWIVRQVNKK